MPLRHTVIRGGFPVAGIFRNVIRPDHSFSFEGRPEDRCIPRHGKIFKSLSRHARQGIECIALAILPDYIVEEGSELRASESGGQISHRLHKLVEVQFTQKSWAN